jgi:hypothetical protein
LALVVLVLARALQALFVAVNHVGNIRLKSLSRFPRVRVRRIAKPPYSVEALTVQLLLSLTTSRSILVIDYRLNDPTTLSLMIDQRRWG